MHKFLIFSRFCDGYRMYVSHVDRILCVVARALGREWQKLFVETNWQRRYYYILKASVVFPSRLSMCMFRFCLHAFLYGSDVNGSIDSTLFRSMWKWKQLKVKFQRNKQVSAVRQNEMRMIQWFDWTYNFFSSYSFSFSLRLPLSKSNFHSRSKYLCFSLQFMFEFELLTLMVLWSIRSFFYRFIVISHINSIVYLAETSDQIPHFASLSLTII